MAGRSGQGGRVPLPRKRTCPARAVVDQASMKVMTIMVNKHAPLSAANVSKHIIRPQRARFKQLFDTVIIQIPRRMHPLIRVLRSNCPIRALATVPPVFLLLRSPPNRVRSQNPGTHCPGRNQDIRLSRNIRITSERTLSFSHYVKNRRKHPPNMNIGSTISG